RGVRFSGRRRRYAWRASVFVLLGARVRRPDHDHFPPARTVSAARVSGAGAHGGRTMAALDPLARSSRAEIPWLALERDGRGGGDRARLTAAAPGGRGGAASRLAPAGERGGR